MTAADYDTCETRVLAHEGGYTNDAVDPGGPTNWGITIFDARKYWKPNATAADVKAMPVSIAKDIYRTKYWAATRCDDLPAGVDDTIFDYSVNSGFGRSGKVLRRVLGINDSDWHVTDEVLAAVRKRKSSDIIVAINDERLRFLQSLRTWPTFGGGWGRRVAEVKTFSLALAGGAVPVQPKKPAPGQGAHPKPKSGPVVAGGSAVAISSGGLAHWIGAHPTISFGLALIIMGIVAFLLQYLKNQHQAKQETPMPNTPIVPVAPPAPSPAAVNDAARTTMVQNAIKP